MLHWRVFRDKARVSKEWLSVFRTHLCFLQDEGMMIPSVGWREKYKQKVNGSTSEYWTPSSSEKYHHRGWWLLSRGCEEYVWYMQFWYLEVNRERRGVSWEVAWEMLVSDPAFCGSDSTSTQNLLLLEMKCHRWDLMVNWWSISEKEMVRRRISVKKSLLAKKEGAPAEEPIPTAC